MALFWNSKAFKVLQGGSYFNVFFGVFSTGFCLLPSVCAAALKEIIRDGSQHFIFAKGSGGVFCWTHPLIINLWAEVKAQPRGFLSLHCLALPPDKRGLTPIHPRESKKIYVRRKNRTACI